MPLTRVYAEGFGPFEKLDLDFSDGNGNPHLGPHILCGVNGCGKSTALRVIAWLLEHGGGGFDSDWLSNRAREGGSQFGLVQRGSQGRLFTEVLHFDASTDHSFPDLDALAFVKRVPRATLDADWRVDQVRENGTVGPRFLSQGPVLSQHEFYAAYVPQPVLRYEHESPSKRRRFTMDRRLAFEAAVDAEEVTKWWVNSFSKRALAKEEGDDIFLYNRTIDRLQQFLVAMSGMDLRAGVQHRAPEPYPLVFFRGGSFNFSQLPDGIRATLGWVCDYLSLTELTESKAPLFEHGGVLLIDEIDTHLHPHWQRRLLYALKSTFPRIQIICTTHSPFVINSCNDAKVHVLEVGEDGVAIVRDPEDAPFGQSFAATIRDIFDVDTQYDWQTEMDLKRWNELKRKYVAGELSSDERIELSGLVDDLSRRSEELRLIVSPGPSIASDRMQEILSSAAQK